MNKKALFIDRDGIICQMVKYSDGWDSPQKVEDVKLVSGIVQVIKNAKNKDFLVIEISNQPGVAKGKQTQELSDAIEARVHELFSRKGVKVDGVYICHHHPQGIIPEFTKECDCRKPKPGLLLRAAKEHNINLFRSILYGDKVSDTQAAVTSGTRSMILLHHKDTPKKVRESENALADFKVKNHKEAVEIIVNL